MRIAVNFRRRMALPVSVSLLMTLAAPTWADTVLSLSVEDGTDLQALHVNDSFRVTVRLTDTDGDLSALGTSIAYNTSLLSEAFDLTPGAIVAPANFLGAGDTAGGSGTFDVFYTDPLGDPITSTGVFFTFRATALAAGSGTIAFAPLASYGFDVNNDLVNLSTGGALNFVVSEAQSGATPLPSAALGGLLLLGGTSTLGRGRRQLTC